MGKVMVEQDGREKEIPSSAVPIMKLKERVFTKRPIRAPVPTVEEKALEQLTTDSSEPRCALS